jgi:hypothetical protein
MYGRTILTGTELIILICNTVGIHEKTKFYLNVHIKEIVPHEIYSRKLLRYPAFPHLTLLIFKNFPSIVN